MSVSSRRITTYVVCNECNTSPSVFFPSHFLPRPLSPVKCNEKSHTSNTFWQCRLCRGSVARLWHACMALKCRPGCMAVCGWHRRHELVTQTCNNIFCLSLSLSSSHTFWRRYACERLLVSLAWFRVMWRIEIHSANDKKRVVYTTCTQKSYSKCEWKRVKEREGEREPEWFPNSFVCKRKPDLDPNCPIADTHNYLMPPFCHLVVPSNRRRTHSIDDNVDVEVFGCACVVRVFAEE